MLPHEPDEEPLAWKSKSPASEPLPQSPPTMSTRHPEFEFTGRQKPSTHCAGSPVAIIPPPPLAYGKTGGNNEMRYFEIYKTGGYAPGPPFVWAAPVEPGRVQTWKLRGLRPPVPH